MTERWHRAYLAGAILISLTQTLPVVAPSGKMIAMSLGLVP